MASGGQGNNEGFHGLVPRCRACALRGLENGITLTFQGSVILDSKDNRLTVKIDLCQKAASLGYDDCLDLLLVRKFHVQNILRGYFQSLSL